MTPHGWLLVLPIRLWNYGMFRQGPNSTPSTSTHQPGRLISPLATSWLSSHLTPLWATHLLSKSSALLGIHQTVSTFNNMNSVPLSRSSFWFPVHSGWFSVNLTVEWIWSGWLWWFVNFLLNLSLRWFSGLGFLRFIQLQSLLFWLEFGLDDTGYSPFRFTWLDCPSGSFFNLCKV